ncbi:hypothetical protein BDW42DRAFT_191044 [Aspergillus taichungensis]|uniref:Uncharacterized protein n=1 Tax=Aspergillus taichungensis TaxID=482145 RepID=A0A2J5I5M5_9EURO|nr:hypothetical protein BDW42DRAFT_191044 [Aspergillus taichungensis]
MPGDAVEHADMMFMQPRLNRGLGFDLESITRHQNRSLFEVRTGRNDTSRLIMNGPHGLNCHSCTDCRFDPAPYSPAPYNPVCHGCAGITRKQDTADALRVISELSVRTLRGYREQPKHFDEHQNLQETLQQTTADLEESGNLADLLYETKQQMRTVIDYLLKKRGTAPSAESYAFKIVLYRVLNQLEGTEGDRTGGSQVSAASNEFKTEGTADFASTSESSYKPV